MERFRVDLYLAIKFRSMYVIRYTREGWGLYSAGEKVNLTNVMICYHHEAWESYPTMESVLKDFDLKR